MSLYCWRSNQAETLAQQMAEMFRQHPLPPMQPEIVLVPGMAMRRWLALRLADQLGIRCHHHFALPASWLYAQAMPHGERILDHARMAWLCYRLLPTQTDDPAFAPVREYLSGDEHGLRRWQLAERIAENFARYQYHRPQWIRQWSSPRNGEDDDWQPRLWRALLRAEDKARDRVALLDEWLESLPQRKDLPSRICMFCVPILPPLLLQAFCRLAEFCDVHMFQLAPTAHYWADLPSERERARRWLRGEGAFDDKDEPGHELLACWGRQGQAMQDLLLDALPQDAQEFELWRETWPETLLGHLQRGIFELQDALPASIAVDDSLQLHICHSPMREVQVLHDTLLYMFEHDPSLRPEDVLVMIPDLASYAPCVEAVFHPSDSTSPSIPWNLSDMPAHESEPLPAAFLLLLELPQRRMTRREVWDLLATPELAGRFQLGHLPLATWEHLFDMLGVRWGLDAEHRRELGLPAWPEQSWQAAEERWLCGYALGDEERWQDIAPIDITSEQAEHLAALSSLLSQLRDWRKRLHEAREMPMDEWRNLMLGMLQAFFDESLDHDGHIQRIRDILDELTVSAKDTRLSLPLLRHLLRQTLRGSTMRHRYLSGGVNICGMRPMRAVPFRVIALLGMQDEDFPRRERRSELDRMSRQRQPGDPHPGEEDRYLMLESVLSARDVLYLSYCGRNMRNDSVRQPSLLLRDLLDVLDRGLPPEAPTRSQRITHEHPMQIFSPSNFQPPNPSFQRRWCQWSRQMAIFREEAPRPWPKPPCPKDGETDRDSLSWRELQGFLRHPLRYFLQRRLHIHLRETEEVVDEETLGTDTREHWRLRQHLLQCLFDRREPDPVLLRADGLLPMGEVGARLLQGIEKDIEPVRQLLRPHTDHTPVFHDIALDIDGVRLTGRIGPCYPGLGLVQASPSRLHGGELLGLWLYHLALCAHGAMPKTACSLLLCRDKERRRLPPLPKDEARERLAGIIAQWRHGRRQPLPLFPRCSWAWMQARDDADRSRKAKEAWYGSGMQEGERSDPYLRLMMRHVEQEPWRIPGFAEQAQIWYADCMQQAREP